MDLKSEGSSELDNEKLITKRRNERFAYILGVITQFLWAIIGI